MTNTYNTLNPLGSTSPKDLFDNASNFDEGMNSGAPSFYDRFKKRRETWAGMQKLVTDFLETMGFEATHLIYVDGTPLTVDRPTQLIERAPSVYKVKAPATFPVNLTGTWATDQLLLVDVGDAALRAALADGATPTNGDAMIAVKKLAAGVSAVARTQHDVNEEEVSLNDFADIPDAITWAMSATGRRSIILPGGDLDMTGNQFLLPVNLTDPAKYGLVRPLYFKSKGGTRIFKNDAGSLFDVAGLVTDPLARFLDLFVSGIEFESDLDMQTVIFNTDQIYRLYVDHCTFRAVDYPFAGTTGNYAQTIRANNNSCHGAKAFIRLDYGFDIKATGNVIEHGTDGFVINGTTSSHVLYSSDISGNVIEGLSGTAIITGATQGTNICANYMEENLVEDFELGTSANSHIGLVVQGNWFQQPAARVTSGSPSINWGIVGPSGAVSGGNISTNGNLHSFVTSSGFVDLQGDVVPSGKQLYSGHTTLLSPTRSAVGRAEFTEGNRKVVSRDTTYVAMDVSTCAVDFGLGAISATISGELIAPCVAVGTANPETTPASYGTRKWAMGSEVINVTPTVLGSGGSQYVIRGWKCITSGQGGGAGTDRWVEMRTATGT